MARADAVAREGVAGEATVVDRFAALGVALLPAALAGRAGGARGGKRRSRDGGRGAPAHRAQSTNAAGTGFSPTAWRRIAQCIASSPRMLAAALARLRSRNSGTAPR